MLTLKEAQKLVPSEMRIKIRNNEWNGPSNRLALGYVQANLVILPKDIAFEFTAFCLRNWAPCPILEVTDIGSPIITEMADGADLRTDLPRYRVFINGEIVDEPIDIKKYWQDDFVGFLIGCSASQTRALIDAGVPVRAAENNTSDSVYISNIQCKPYGPFKGPMVVSVRPMPEEKIIRAVQITTRFHAAHGVPVHIGDPKHIGIEDLSKFDFGGPPEVRDGEVPVFWGCGVTPQTVAVASKPKIMIAHYPGHMFLCDKKDAEISIL